MTDFGLARFMHTDEKEVAKTLCGTTNYMAPETILRSGHSSEVDWWALGVLTYEMVIGFVPFFEGFRNGQPYAID